MKKNEPDFEKKVTCVTGNVCHNNLGMSDEIYENLTKEITHVFHSAATVRFNESLKSSTETNVLGLKKIINFCNDCTNIKVFYTIYTKTTVI